MIELRDIHKSFGELDVLKGISLTIGSGEMVSIIGRSGAGKTTLLQIIGTLEKPTSGEVLVDGMNVFRYSDNQLAAFRNRHIGFIFQLHQLLPEFTAVENVMMPALIGGWGREKAFERAGHLLNDLGLSQRMSHKPSELSGGERQRVAAARALMMSPKVILADEPSGSLDEANKADLHHLLRQLRDDYGHTIIIVTHDKALAEISDEIYEMRDGLLEKYNS